MAKLIMTIDSESEIENALQPEKKTKGDKK